MATTIETDLKEVLGEIKSQLNEIQRDVTTLKVDMATVKADITGEHLTFVTPKLGFMSSYLESLATT